MTSNPDFNAKTQASEVVKTFAESIKGKISKFIYCSISNMRSVVVLTDGIVLITGVGPNGLGASIADALASQDPGLLILTGRTLSKVEQITKQLASKYPSLKTR